MFKKILKQKVTYFCQNCDCAIKSCKVVDHQAKIAILQKLYFWDFTRKKISKNI